LILGASCTRSPEERHASFLASGKKQLAAKDYHRAILDFHNAIQAKPKDAEAHYQLALAYLEVDRFKEAIPTLQQAVTLDPKHSAAQLKLSELMISSRDQELVKDAEARIQKILTDNPGDEDALFTLAAARSQTGQLAETEKILNQTLTRSPAHLKSALALALLKVSQRDLAGAEQILQKSVAQTPGAADAAVALGTLYAASGKWEASETQLSRAIQLQPEHAGAWNTLGAVQVRSGKIREAEQTYKRAASLPHPEQALVYVSFLIQQNRRPAAIAELERMVKENRNNRIARSALIAGYLAMNRGAEAETILNDALKANSKDLQALLQRSQIYLRSNKYDAAEADLDQAAGIDPASAQLHYLRAKVFRSKGDYHRQKQELFETLRLAPSSLTTRFELARALVDSNETKSALQTLDGAPPSQRSTLPFVVVRNWVVIASGDRQTARNVLDAALPRVKTTELLLQDAILKLSTNDLTGAQAALEPVLKLDPGDLRALSLLTQISIARNQRQTATDWIRQLVQQRPRAARLQIFWAQWLLENNQKAEARQALAAAISADPKNTVSRLILATLDLQDQKPDQAREHLTATFSINPRNTDTLMLFARLEESNANRAKAIEHYRTVLAIDTRHVGALNNLAYALSRDPSRLDEALSMAQKAKELDSNSPQVRDTLGWIYYQKGMYGMAARELEGALALNAQPVIQLHLGLAYNRLGETEKGGRMVAAALAKEPKLAELEEDMR
jgi:tetratricopeptide (TPR) repeat protein